MEIEYVHEYNIPVRWSDFDMQGVVNNATYLTFLEEAHLDYFKFIQLSWEWGKKALVVASSSIIYKKPITYGSPLTIFVNIEKIGNKSLTLGFTIASVNKGNNQIFSTATIVLVAYDFLLQVTVPFTVYDIVVLQKSKAAVKKINLASHGSNK